MNKSLEYVKKRIEDGNCNNMTTEEFADMGVTPFKFFFENKSDGTITLASMKDTNEVVADLRYDPEADFNYFVTETCVCDGTLMFMTELMSKILVKIQSLGTCYQPAMDSIRPDVIDNYKMHYTVGDFVTNSYIVELPDKDRPWMRDKFTVMLPVKFTLEKR